jgi:hypothetical protein
MLQLFSLCCENDAVVESFVQCAVDKAGATLSERLPFSCPNQRCTIHRGAKLPNWGFYPERTSILRADEELQRLFAMMQSVSKNNDKNENNRG